MSNKISLDNLDIQSRLSKTWRVFGKHEITYTGGPVQYSKDLTHMICVSGEDPTKMVFFRLKTGQVVHEMDCGEEDPIGTFTLSPNQKILYTFHIRSGLIKSWDIETKKMTLQFKSDHKNDLSMMECDPTGTLLATASLDQTVRIRYATNGHLTHYFPAHGSAISSMTWHPSIEKLLLAVGTANGVIRLHWLGSSNDIQQQQQTNNKKNQQQQANTSTSAKYIDLLRADYEGTPNKSHVGRVTAMAWSHCQTKLISVGYDKMFRVWDLCFDHNTELQQKKQQRKCLDLLKHLQPQLSLEATEIASHLVLDELENVSLIPYGCAVPMRKQGTNEYISKVLEEDNNCCYFLTSGNKGVSSIWKVNYDYLLKKKSNGIIFKHQSVQSYQSNNIPYDGVEYRNKLYAQTPEQTLLLQQQEQRLHNKDNTEQALFETPLHFQWHKQHLFVPPAQIQSPITITTT